MERRVVIHSPTGKDARLIAQVLEKNSIECIICDARSVTNVLSIGGGALIVADEALTPEFIRSLRQYLNSQATWSDLPILILTSRSHYASEISTLYPELGNVTLLERPVKSLTLVSAAASALRARGRQYEIREIDRRKDEFLAMLAHELRNPLAPVAAASELLKVPTISGERIRQTSEIISRQVRHMTGLIDDLLDVSRVSRGLVSLDKVEVDVRHVINNALEQVRPLIENRHQRLTVQTTPDSTFVNGDQKRLVQIVANVLNNATKYTPEGGDIELALDATEFEIILSVVDTGIGMNEAVISRVFDMFSQAETTPDRSQGGLGIGLALVKSLVDLHGGSVDAFSEGSGTGSRFTIRLPRVLESVEPYAPLHAKPSSEPAKGRKILLVDDNVDAAQMLGMFLEMAGYEVIIENSALAAIARAALELPDVCLLDIGLPDMDGTQLARVLRGAHDTAHATLIAITGYGQDGDRQKTSAAGFDHHFVKPVDMSELMDALAALS